MYDSDNDPFGCQLFHSGRILSSDKECVCVCVCVCVFSGLSTAHTFDGSRLPPLVAPGRMLTFFLCYVAALAVVRTFSKGPQGGRRNKGNR